MKTKLTIHKIAQVDRICRIAWANDIHPSTLRGVHNAFRAYGYLAAWQRLVENNLHQY